MKVRKKIWNQIFLSIFFSYKNVPLDKNAALTILPKIFHSKYNYFVLKSGKKIWRDNNIFEKFFPEDFLIK